jgi:hypothetical protein
VEDHAQLVLEAFSGDQFATMNPVGATIIFVVALVLFFAPRKWAALAFVGGAIFVTQAQAVRIVGMSFYATRIWQVVGIIRVLSRGELSMRKLVPVDKAVLFLYTFTTLVFVLRSSEGQANMIGVGSDAVLAYFIFRGLLGGMVEVLWFLRTFVYLLIPYAIMVLIERHVGRTLWYSMGGFYMTDWTRNGILRCQGSFRHPSLLGTLGASYLPLYIALLFGKADRKLALWAIASCLVIVWVSNSGGPMNFAASGIVGWSLWKIRTQMKWVRRGLSILILALAALMKAPVWFLLERISDLSGGDGWHRSELIDQAIGGLHQWWLFGMDMRNTASWFPYELDFGTADITNQFILFGLNAGLLSTAAFITLLCLAFSFLGKAMNVLRSQPDAPKIKEYLLWGLGVMLAGHIFNWLGITYFDQIYVIWFMQLATIVNLSEEILTTAGEKLGPAIEAETSNPPSIHSTTVTDFGFYLDAPNS